MKKIFLIATLSLLISYLLTSCKKEENRPNLALVTEVADSLLVPTDTTILFTANVSVRLRILQANGGIFISANSDSTNVAYRTPRNVGIYTVQLINKADTSQKIQRTFIVSPQVQLFRALRRGGHVLSFRHALAANGSDTFRDFSTNWWKSCDNTVARQLTIPDGRVQSEKMGRALKILKIPVGRIISSEYCRCIQTAQFMNLGINIETSPLLTYYVYDEANRYANTFRLMREQTISNRNVLFITHVGYPSVPPNLNPVLSTLNQGDAGVFRLNPNNAEPTYVQVLKANDLTDLIR
ncbi:MAG: hypothetical protein OHK0057_14290 [Thermoflexibacter sp.]